MALFAETRQGFVVKGFGVVIFWRLMVVRAAGYWTIILPPPPTWPREKGCSIPPQGMLHPNWGIPLPPGRRGVACWIASGVVLLLLHIIRVPPSQQR